MRVLRQTLKRLEDAALVGAIVCLALMAVGITTGVIARYIFQTPLASATILVEAFFAPGLAFLALSATQRVGQHISVSFVHSKLPEAARRLVSAMSSLISGAIFLLLTVLTFNRAFVAFQIKSLVPETVFQTWIGYAFVPIGAALLTARLFVETSEFFGRPKEPSAADKKELPIDS